MDVNDTPALNESLWAFERGVEGYIVAALYIIIIVFALAWNSFVIVVMLCKKLVFKESSTVFLFALALVDLIGTAYILPLFLVTVLAGGWILGDTDYTRNIVCEATGFAFSIFLALSIHILALISVDRMLMIVMVLQYPRYMKPWVAWLCVLGVLIVALILSTTPFYGLGNFFYFEPFGGCVPQWRGQLGFIGMYVGEHIIPVATIVITSLITFVYVRKFLRKVERRQSQWSLSPHNVVNDHRAKQRSTTRIFVLLVITQVICFFPVIFVAVVGVIRGTFDDYPNIVFLICFVLLMSNAVANPIIQSIFRKEIRDVILGMYRKVCKRRRKVDNVNSNSSEAPVTTATEAPSVGLQSKLTVVPSNRHSSSPSNGHSPSPCHSDLEGEFDNPKSNGIKKQVSFHLKTLQSIKPGEDRDEDRDEDDIGNVHASTDNIM